ncbi:cation diffusion facilitator family transporter [uncultured Methanosphaera sp.]|uniref:cation diffusion facilitator family transporter n=1 Tax=uncultured Methanosphaera sp. TaxID=262501 RepID=UPI000DC3D0C3|nr:cation diffusion facilitator family transporter [uncultured Methanosphaera sp.]RAP45325.1 MAG: hypothetical protein BZ134_01445 [Methanosphaera sp. SHI1033]
MKNYYRKVNRILIIVFFFNLLVSIIKLGYGFHANILSIRADGYDSLFDAISNILGMAAVYVSCKPCDSEHRYGHSKIETFASLIIALSLLIVSYEIITAAIDRFNGVGIPNVTLISYIVLIITVIINYIVSLYEKRKGEEYNSDILISDSQHTKSDSLATLVIIIGLIFIQMGYVILDPILSIFVAILILKAGIEILYKNINVLMDKSVIPEKDIRKIIMPIPGVIDVHNIRSRGTNSMIFMDMHLVLSDNLSLTEAYDISHKCEEVIKEKYPEVEDIMIRLEPIAGIEDKQTYK